ncbi:MULTISPECIES: hypothetical protein [unclassified Bradyrhizobium]|uniref:hypothetical protein n=1 Tax=Bradyrhizobium sp. USDA 4541 TaxID=2817704 RepID=UPI00209D2CD4|nr:hypothetical protein [Bradyrhizobium sp. USDA 4541]MCP1848078.1 hypothetical protein [Bradyrhizobium sp. USDA 4541]MCP1911982.1 hypothetical protein [Bradyrhizobium elkanii]
MTSSHPAILNRPRAGVVRSVALVGAALGSVALTLGILVATARADNARDEPRSENANVQRRAQNPPPARVILPAPWEQAAPAQPVAAPAKPADRK